MDRLKILVVEDDRSLLELYDIALSGDIFDKRLVDSGEEAMEAYRRWRPDILLLDILLPDMSGRSVLKEIRGSLSDESTAIIMSTSSDFRDDIEQCEELGIQGYIVKPFNQREIANNILKFYESVNPERAEAAIAELAKAGGKGL